LLFVAIIKDSPLAAWRRSTRPGMIVHAMADIWGGWLKGALHFPY
jgi:hypothetical protein